MFTCSFAAAKERIYFGNLIETYLRNPVIAYGVERSHFGLRSLLFIFSFFFKLNFNFKQRRSEKEATEMNLKQFKFKFYIFISTWFGEKINVWVYASWKMCFDFIPQFQKWWLKMCSRIFISPAKIIFVVLLLIVPYSFQMKILKKKFSSHIPGSSKTIFNLDFSATCFILDLLHTPFLVTMKNFKMDYEYWTNFVIRFTNKPFFTFLN